MEEALGRTLSKIKKLGDIKGIRPANNYPSFTHHQFVDDTILIGKANIEEDRIMKFILDKYEKASSQKINYNKTNIYFSNTPQWRR